MKRLEEQKSSPSSYPENIGPQKQEDNPLHQSMYKSYSLLNFGQRSYEMLTPKIRQAGSMYLPNNITINEYCSEKPNNEFLMSKDF